MEQKETKKHISDTDLDEEYRTILHQLSPMQYRFIIARLESKSDAEAARTLEIDVRTPAKWEEKKLIDRALELVTRDGAVLALTMRKKVISKAMAVKISGLESDDERIRQTVATEILENEFGKPTTKSEINTTISGSLNLTLEKFVQNLVRVYGKPDD